MDKRRKRYVSLSNRLLAIAMTIALVCAFLPNSVIASISDYVASDDMEEVENLEEMEETEAVATDSLTGDQGFLISAGVEGALGSADSLNVKDVTEDEDENVIAAVKEASGYLSGVTVKAYQMGLTKNGEQVDLSGNAEISVPTAKLFDSTDYAVYAVDEEGKVEWLASNEGDTLEFSVSELGTFYVVGHAEVELTDSTHDVAITEISEGALNTADSVVVEDITDSTSSDVLDAVIQETGYKAEDVVTTVLDISLADNASNTVQPDGKILVSVAIPDDMDADSFEVYYIGENGEETPQKVDGTISNGYFEFEREHLCNFCLTSLGVNHGEDSSGSDENDAATADANIHWFVQNAEASTFYITNGAELRGLALLLQDDVIYDKDNGTVVSSSGANTQTATKTGFTGKTIILSCDITMSNTVFPGIGTDTNPFKGTFDGNGNIIKNLHLAGSASGLFNEVSDGTIKNLGIENAVYTGTEAKNVGILAGKVTSSTVNSCYVYGSSLTTAGGDGTYCGYLFGELDSASTVKYSYAFNNEYSITSGQGTASSFGYVNGTNSNISNCFVDNSIIAAIEPSGVSVVEAALFSDSSGTGVVAQINDAASQEKGSTISIYKVSAGHPMFGEAAVTEVKEGTLSVRVANNNAVSTKAGYVYYSYTGDENYSSTATSFDISTVDGYDEVYVKTVPANKDYTFKGWYNNIQGTGEALSTNTVYAVSGYESKTIYAVYTGGPYSANLYAVDVTDLNNPTAGGGTVWFELADGTTSTDPYVGDRNSFVKIHAQADSGYAFIGWYSGSTAEATVDLDADTFLSDSLTEDCVYTLKLTGDLNIKAVFAPAVTVEIRYATGSTADMGVMDIAEGHRVYNDTVLSYATASIGKGGVYTLKASSLEGYEFAGFYKDAECTEEALFTTAHAGTYSLASDYGEATLVYYAKFEEASAAGILQDGVKMTIADEGQLLSKVIYQYSGTGAYAYSTWYRFAINGQGYSATNVRKTDYEMNKNAYAWNGSSGYKSLTSGINGYTITAKYSGYYTFLCYPKGGVMYTRTIYISPEQMAGAAGEPTVTTDGLTATINDNGSEILASFYQLTDTNTSKTEAEVADATSWYRYTVNGQAEDVGDYNGEEGYITVGANSGGTEITMSAEGWYTFWIKFGEGEIVKRKVLITTEEAEEVGDAVIKVLANALTAGTPEVVMKVKVSKNVGGTNYGVKIQGTDTVFAMTGNYYGGYYYIDITSGLTAATSYTFVPVYYKDGIWNEFGNAKAVTTEAAQSYETVSGMKYYKGTTGVSYRNCYNSRTSATNLDTRGYQSGQSVQTTFANQGWTVATSGSDNVAVNQTATIITGNSGNEYVQYRYILRNNSSSAVTGYKLGIWTDVQIGNNDSAPVYKQDFGFNMEDDNRYNTTYGLSFALIANKDGEPDGLNGKSTTASTVWFGGWSSAQGNVFSTTDLSSLTGRDSGAACSWQNITIPAGDCYVINCIMGVVPSSVLSVSVSADPGVAKDGATAEIKASGSSSVTNTIDEVYYQYSSDSSAANCPYSYTDYVTGTYQDEKGTEHTGQLVSMDFTGFKENGIQYKTVNGVTGYKTMKAPIYEADEYAEDGVTVTHKQNNIINFTEPGWYTILVKYTETGLLNTENPEDGTYSYQKLKPFYIRVTVDDLTNVPNAKAIDDTIAIFNNGSTITSVTYQVTDTDYTAQTVPTVYTTWYRFTKTGQGYDEADMAKPNQATYLAANGANGYKSVGSGMDGADTATGCKQIRVNQSGWYTVIIKYKDAEDKVQTVTRYVCLSEDAITQGAPSVQKSGSVITVSNYYGTISKVLYQLTTYNDAYMTTSGSGVVINKVEEASGDDATAFLDRYEYGKGYVYTQTGENEYRKSNTTGSFTIFSRLGLFTTAEDYTNYVAAAAENPGNDTRDALLVTTNGTGGYRTSHLAEGTGTAVIQAKTPGWYTIQVTYGSNITVSRYVQITEADIRDSGPEATIDPLTGNITVSANGCEVTGAYLNYATDSVASKYPASTEGMTYYLTSANAYSFYGFYTYGQTHFTGINAPEGYYKISMSRETDAQGSFGVYAAGWYNLYLTYVDNGETKTRVQHLLMPTGISGPKVQQYDVGEGISRDKRMLITYTDDVTSPTYEITKYMYGYVGAERPETAIASWYRMSLACDGNVTVKTDSIATDGAHRTINMVVDKVGWWCVCTYDQYYGTHYYMVQVTDDDMTIHDNQEADSTRLTVDGANIKATRDGGSICFIKDITGCETEEAKLAVPYTAGDMLTLREGNVRTIRTIDNDGRVCDTLATLYNIEVDKTQLAKQIEKANKYLGIYTPKPQDEYDAMITAGSYAVDSYYTLLQATVADAVDVGVTGSAITRADGLTEATPQMIYADENATLTEVDDAVALMMEVLASFEANSKVIEPDLVEVSGNTITVSAPAGSTIEYVIYSANEEYTIETGTRDIRETVWDSWPGVASEAYSRADSPRNNELVLTDVPDGIYTFQIKVDGVVYFRNPIVSTSGEEIDKVTTFMGGADKQSNLIKEATDILADLTKLSVWKEEGDSHTTTYFVQDKLYDLLSATLTEAKYALDHYDADAMTKNAEEKAKKEADPSYVMVTYYDLDAMVQQAANLNNAIRRVKAGRSTQLMDHSFDVTTVTAATGNMKAVSTTNNVEVAFVARGEYTNWSEFCKHSYKTLTPAESETPWTSYFDLQADGIYTAYVKYTDGVYEFKSFNLTGYTGYPLTITGSGAQLTITADNETKDKVEQVAIAYGSQDKYDEELFKDVTLTDGSATVDIMGMGEHTVYTKIDGVEYLIPGYPEGIPVVNVTSHNSSGGTVSVYTDSTKVAWVAYADGECEQWTDMLMSSSGVHYITQNEPVTISAWTSDIEKYTFFIKGSGDNPDYIVSVSGNGATVAVTTESYAN